MPSRRPLAAALALLIGLAGSVVLAVAAAPPAAAAGTVTVNVQGRGDVTGDGITCSETGGSDCAQFYADEQVCDPELKPPCFFVAPEVTLTAGPDRNGFAFMGFTGCTQVTGRTCSVTVSSSKMVTATFADVTNPTVALSAPSGVVRGTVSISATASDNVAVSRVDFLVRGFVVGSDSSAPYQATFDSASTADGAATVTARAFDTSGRSSDSNGSLTIDNTAPVLGVTGPDNAIFGPGTTQTWSLTASDVTSGPPVLSCVVAPLGTSPAFGACNGGASHQVTGLPHGSYVFYVRAVDGAGNTTSDARVVTIDATPPTSTIVSGPSSGSVTSSRTATFAMTASEPGSTFECRTYPFGTAPPVFGACSGGTQHVLAGLADGGHTFEVRAIDTVGNVESTPSTRAFTVDATAPETSFTKTPRSVIRSKKRKVTVRFVLAASEAGSFRCSLDGKAYAACSPEISFKVRRGGHTLRVIATDAAGNADATPATYSWKVKKKR